MGRWIVERWADPNVVAWVAWNENKPDRMMLFPTHAEALDYADKKARTREVVLPRPTRTFNGRPEFDFSEESGLDYNTPRTAVYDGALDLEYCCDTTVLIPREHWRPLAAALWALAEQEGR